jgi:hypothetical protein
MTAETTKVPKKKPLAKSDAPVVRPLLDDVRELILQAREGVARAVDSGLTTVYWHVGRRVRQDILKEKRAEYGGQIVSALGRQLEMEFGRGFSEKSLRHMIRFVETFPDFQIVSALLRQLSWTHFVSLIYLDDPLRRDFCTGKRHETIELLDLEQSGIRVSSYWTEALPKKELEQKLHEAVRLARLRFESGKD